jgi:hypothetical protein
MAVLQSDERLVHPVTKNVFVTYRYRNAAVHRFDADGRHIP